MSIKTINDMIDWVEDHIEDDPALVKLACHVGYSEFYCSAKFHEFVGVSYKEYVLRRKLSLAAATLRETKARILEIALQFGFSSHEAFSRAFKKQYGISPCRYRQQRWEIPPFEKAQIPLRHSFL